MEKIDLVTGAITLVAGQPYKREWCPVYTQGPIATAEFVEPENVIVNKKGEILFTDQRINRVIKIADGRYLHLLVAISSILVRRISPADHRKVIKMARH